MTIALFSVRKFSFCTGDTYVLIFKDHYQDVSLQFKESFIFSSLWVKRREICFNPGKSFSYLQLLILLAGDIEICPDATPARKAFDERMLLNAYHVAIIFIFTVLKV